MRRRNFIASLASVTVARPLAARAQQPDRMRLIGVLMAYAESDSAAQSWLAAFRAALAKLGWTQGSNLRIELRWSAADPDKIRTFAKELLEDQREAAEKEAASRRRYRCPGHNREAIAVLDRGGGAGRLNLLPFLLPNRP
jgi:hypothetical protein